MDRAKASRLWEEAKANVRRVAACRRHRFDITPPILLGKTHTCVNCGGRMSLGAIGSYIQGYEAAGGSADDVWPGYRRN